jgi:predicted MFS family arabinose efflux permease
MVFCAVAALWNCSLNLAGPFFSVYMVESLRASASTVGTLDVIATLAALPGQRLFGILADRWGPRRVQLITGLLIPIIPLGWVLSRSAWHLVPVQLAVGFLWAGYALASFNFLLVFTPEDRRSHYTALYQIAVTVGLAGGAVLGGIIATHWGYKSVFIVSSLGRLGAALLFARFVRQTGQPAQGLSA